MATNKKSTTTKSTTTRASSKVTTKKPTKTTPKTTTAPEMAAKPASSRPTLSAKPSGMATTPPTTPPAATTAVQAAAAATTAAAAAAKATASPLSGVTQPEAGQGIDPTMALTKKDLLEKVSAKAGVRKAQARPIVEAMLDVLGAALVRGETLKLQPMGIMKVTRQKEIEQADIVVCKLRRKKSQEGDNDPLAEAAE